MNKKQDVAAHEPVDLTDDAGFMDTGVLYSDQEAPKPKDGKSVKGSHATKREE